MDFSQALIKLKDGYKLVRRSWIGKQIVWIMLQRLDSDSRLTEPFICAKYYNGDITPYSLNDEDILAGDWETIATKNHDCYKG